MRILPAYLALRLITGQSIRTKNHSKEQRIRDGHRMLVAMGERDHGYDLIAWHNELCKTRAGGYSWGKRRGVPKYLQNAMADSNWLDTIAEIRRVDANQTKHQINKRDVP